MRLKEFLQQGGLITDPNKIQNIINRYGNGKSPFKASDYIEVAQSTGVPVELLLAQGIAESNFGTAGRAVRTKNVGNVGNTDSGAAEYRSSWKDGLYRQANLLKKEYKVNNLNDVQRLISTNFARPAGGNYASASDYGMKVGKLINSFSNNKFNIASPQNQDQYVQGDYNIAPREVTMPKEMFENLNDWNKFSSAAKKNPELLNLFSADTKSQFEENTRLENERLKQEEIKSQVEAENQRIQMALQEKQQQRAQILSMVPQSQSITYGDIKPMMQKGGWIPFSQRTPKTEKIRTFYNDMITSDWYRDRLEANGYNSKLNPGNWFSNGAQDEADYRARRVQYTRVNNLDMSKNPYSAEEAMRYKDAKEAGTHWMPRTNEINRIMNDPMMDYNNVDPDSAIAHEFGHPESAGRLNSYEYDLLESKLSNRTKDDHDKSPYESKADINALRYNLYKQGLFDPKTGRYKTKTGKFDSSLLKNVRTDFITERLLQNYDTKNLEYLLNTIAMNDNSNNLENIV